MRHYFFFSTLFWSWNCTDIFLLFFGGVGEESTTWSQPICSVWHLLRLPRQETTSHLSLPPPLPVPEFIHYFSDRYEICVSGAWGAPREQRLSRRAERGPYHAGNSQRPRNPSPQDPFAAPPQAAAVTWLTTAPVPHARMDSTGNGNAPYQATLHADGKQGGKKKENSGGTIFQRKAEKEARDWLRATQETPPRSSPPRSPASLSSLPRGAAALGLGVPSSSQARVHLEVVLTVRSGSRSLVWYKSQK